MKILVIKPSSFGDIVQSDPTLVALKEAYPSAQISWLVFDSFQDLMPLFPGVDRAIVWQKDGGIKEFRRVLHEVRAEKYDIAIDLQGLARTALLTLFSGAKKRIGAPGMKELSWLLVKQVFPKSRTMNAVERSLETVRYLTGKKYPVKYRLQVPKDIKEFAAEMMSRFDITARDRVVGIVPTARGKHKIWPVEHYRELIGRIVEASPDTRIIILGTTDDLRLVRHSMAIDLSGRTTLLQLAGILERCSVVVGPDTGTVHLASALGVPVIALFGGSDVRETAPIGPGAKVMTKNFPCSPCRGRVKCKQYRCLADITPQEVFEAVKDTLKFK